MSESRLGPYRDQKTANSIAQAFIDLGEKVMIEETWTPYERKSRQYEAYVIREASA